MNDPNNTNKHFLTKCGLYFSLLVFMCSSVSGKVFSDWEVLLEEMGYPTDTVEQIIEATKSEKYPVRFLALELLTQRTGEKAITTLKEALNDERMEVRWHAAHWLGTLGDKSGLEQMRQDLKEFAPHNGAPIPPDPNVTDPCEIKEREGKRNLHLCYALRAAKVLAELDDRRGYELAARMALDGAWGAQRINAVYALAEIARVDPNILAAEGKDPASVLRAMAESEKNQAVFGTLISFTGRLPSEMAVPILELAIESPHQSEKMHNVAKFILDKVKAKKKPAEE